ncbi:DivIVA domain-containing protein [Mammaliicoccus vitulinus]|uniref:DivIVA domain-containing protein n=1 Tax=Mammaliicoccus vitulinus TaxID=71237 RepID=A0ABX7HFH5_9STAP|nr:DivIVA domain-containing protein [Mammaliicoccus vitulinus]MBM6628733.1 DivIVA domain-containing protein [Mammaliicoccus vitulinus]MBO3076790.1 DivIVA domain-containing protein [Mammaliicoccus vitulinus]MEB7656463.1 DivIVA domain-containing protein [Mammaliicoccus vitulinus]PNZ40414.1 DivIVA domain-containing protein [Mammaliicoccus vitulinus]QJF24840.1 DivIVA domain-containing protein [Mammaliicoccus vitulinus]
MAFTPEEIKQKEFSRVHKGLDETEVREYLQTLSNEIEKLKADKEQLQTLINDKDENINRFKAVENTISEALLQAQKAGEETKHTAILRADAIVKEAEGRSDQIINDALQKARHISFQTEDMKRQSKVFRSRFRMLVEAQLDLLKNEDWDYLLNYDVDQQKVTEENIDILNKEEENNQEQINNQSVKSEEDTSKE